MEARYDLDLRSLTSVVPLHDASASPEDLCQDIAIPHSFRLNLVDGTTLDLYADTETEMQAWLRALGRVIEELPKRMRFAEYLLDA